MALISTYYAGNGDEGKAEVHKNMEEGTCFIRYYDSNGIRFFTEEFPGKSLYYVEDAAENWALGIKKLEGDLLLG
jgi:hypothetical protein